MGRWERVKVVAERMELACDFSLPKRMNACMMVPGKGFVFLC